MPAGSGIGAEKPKRLGNPFGWTSETHYGRCQIKVNMDTHHKMCERSSASVDCRQDGSKYVSKNPQKRVRSPVWKAMRSKHKHELWRPQPDALYQRKMDDHYMTEMLEQCKPGVTTQLPEHVLRYRLHRLKHPNFLPKAHALTEERLAMDNHNTFVQRASHHVDMNVSPWCLKWMNDKHAEKFTKSGSLKKELLPKKARPKTATELKQAQHELLQFAPDEELLPPKRGSPMSAAIKRPASIEECKAIGRPHTVPEGRHREDVETWTSHDDLLRVIATHKSAEVVQQIEPEQSAGGGLGDAQHDSMAISADATITQVQLKSTSPTSGSP